MLDTSAPKGKIVAAAMKLAALKPWSDVTMREIADEAGLDLVALRREVPSKPAILAAFIRAADDAMLARAPKLASDQPPRDRLFDVIMTRFDVLAPYKAGLKSVMESRPMDCSLAKKAFASQAWMLHAAGIGTDGPLGSMRVAGLGPIYAAVTQTWLEDDEPDLARTMAALDRRLKRGEESMRIAHGVCDGVNDIVSGIGRMFGRAREARSDRGDSPKQADTSAPPAPATF